MIPVLAIWSGLSGCTPLITSYQLSPSYEPIREPWVPGDRVSKTTCQRWFALFGYIWSRERPLSLADQLEALGAAGPLVRVVVEETWKPRFWSTEQCLKVSATRARPGDAVVSAPAPTPSPAAVVSAPAPTPSPAAVVSAPAPRPSPVVRSPAPAPAPAPAPPPPPREQVQLAILSHIGVDGDQGVKALRTALDGVQDALVACFSGPGTVSLDVTLTKVGAVKSATRTDGDPASAACAIDVIAGLQTARIPWTTKMGLELTR